MDDLVEGVVGFAVGGLDFRQSDVGLSRAALEEAVGQRTAHPLAKEHKEQRYAGSLVSETIGLAPPITFEQAVAFHLAQVIAQLGDGVSFGGEGEAERIACWRSIVRQPKTLVPVCSSTSISRSMRVS